ncbi:MAG: thiazole biosynthesis adenylyltransferase ThiF, partial [Planctomycetia bacterium]
GVFFGLEALPGALPTALCGREAVQVMPATPGVDLAVLAARLPSVANSIANQWIVRAQVEPGLELAVFADGRAIVSGTRDETRARAIVARYLGS